MRPSHKARSTIVPRTFERRSTTAASITITSTGTPRLVRVRRSPDPLCQPILDVLLNHQKVKVTALIGVATSMRSEQDHLGKRRRRIDQCTAGTLDLFARRHSRRLAPKRAQIPHTSLPRDAALFF
jgi:hypothetical protein